MSGIKSRRNNLKIDRISNYQILKKEKPLEKSTRLPKGSWSSYILSDKGIRGVASVALIVFRIAPKPFYLQLAVLRL